MVFQTIIKRIYTIIQRAIKEFVVPSFTSYIPHFFSPKMSLKTGVRIIRGNIFFAFFPTVKFTVTERAQVIRWAIFGDSPIPPSFGRGSSQIL